MGIEISAIVATYNRAAYLRKALGGMVAQTLHPDRFEIIVVDNGSKDETPQVCSEFEAPNLRYLYEPVTGVSRARNTGWQNARGEYVAFLDDDGIPSPGWLEAMLAVFNECKPQPGMAAGPIEGIWEAPRPDWLSDEILHPLGIFDWGNARKKMTDQGWLPIGNMAVLKSLLERAGGLREDLDRQGTKLRANGEVYFSHQVVSWGYDLVYDPGILMYHHARAARLTQEYFKNWFYWQGLSDAVMLNLEKPLGRFARMRLAAGKVAWAAPRWVLMCAARNSAQHFQRQCQIVEVRGMLTGLLRPDKEEAA
jgi:glucosyl-dolichyl phosphate glucuronosyltransferase